MDQVIRDVDSVQGLFETRAADGIGGEHRYSEVVLAWMPAHPSEVVAVAQQAGRELRTHVSGDAGHEDPHARLHWAGTSRPRSAASSASSGVNIPLTSTGSGLSEANRSMSSQLRSGSTSAAKSAGVIMPCAPAATALATASAVAAWTPVRSSRSLNPSTGRS